MCVLLFRVDHRNWEGTLHDNGTCERWRTFRLYRPSHTAVREAGSKALRWAHRRHWVPSQERGLSQRSKTWESATWLRQHSKDCRLRPLEYVWEKPNAKNGMWVALLRCAGDDRWKALPRTTVRYLVQWCSFLRHGRRLLALRRPEDL